MNSLTNCSFDAVPVSLLIVHQLVMCQNFLMLRYPMLIADGAARFFLNDGTSNIRCCYQTSYYVVRRVCTSILIVHNLRMVKNFQADRRKSYIQNVAADAQPSPLFDVQPSFPIPLFEIK